MATPDTGAGGFGKYRLIAELGHGGMAEVFLAIASGPAGFNKLVVLKQIRDQLADDPEFLAMFLDEARLAARLNHPNVVQTNEVGEDGRRYFIAMEYLEGQPLNRIVQRLAKDGRLALPMHVRILIDALAGLHYAHELADFDGTSLQVVHRDATPHNIFVTYAGQVKVVDFGIAKALGSSSETRAGVLKGKVSYMAPEQALGERVDRRADVFAVGIMLWEALAGRRPFKGHNDVVILQKLVAGEIPSPGTVRDDIPELLEAICMKALAHDREERYATAEDMQRALEAALEKLGERPQLRDVGDLVAKTFADERLRIRGVIEAQMANIRTSGEFPTPEISAVGKSHGRLALPRIDAPPTESGSFNSSQRRSITSVDPGSGPRTDPSRVSSLTANTTLAEPTPPPPAPAKKPIALYGIVAVAVAVAAAAIAWPRGQAMPTPTSPTVAAAPITRMIRIESTPPGATVSENDKVLGQTPMAIPLDPSQQSARQLVLSLDGYAPYTVHQGPSLEDVRVLVPLTVAVAVAPKSTADAAAATHTKPPPGPGPAHATPPPTGTPKPATPSPLDINMNR
ncbi:MAG: serine/threonine-protein kinase [Byssovorax sp.]